PGKYRLQSRPVSDGWAPTYYPNVTDPASAETITVREGIQLDSYDIRLPPPFRRSLRGLVRDNTGEIVPSAEVAIAASEFTEQLVKVKSDANGAFELKSVPPDEWQITAVASRDGVRWSGATRVIMPDRDVDDVELRIDPP